MSWVVSLLSRRGIKRQICMQASESHSLSFILCVSIVKAAGEWFYTSYYFLHTRWRKLFYKLLLVDDNFMNNNNLFTANSQLTAKEAVKDISRTTRWVNLHTRWNWWPRKLLTFFLDVKWVKFIARFFLHHRRLFGKWLFFLF